MVKYKSYQKPYRIKRKKSIFRNRFFWLVILVLMISGGIFYLLFLSSPFQIQEIKISGNEKVLIEDVKSLIEKAVEKKILVFQTKSIFLTTTNQIQEIVFRNFPQIAKVEFKKQLPQTLVIKIEERKPIAIFSQNENYFFIDNEGIIFEKKPETVNLKPQQPLIENLLLRAELKLGDRAVEKELLSQILEVKSQIENELEIPINEVLIVSEDRLNFKTLEGWEFYFNPQKDSNWQLRKLKAVLETEIPLGKRKDLEYIELRFGDLAPFKYRAGAR